MKLDISNYFVHRYSMKIRISIPATSANIGAGYDIWGLALNLRNIVQCDLSYKVEATQIKPNYSQLLHTTTTLTTKPLEQTKDNLFIYSYQYLFDKIGKPTHPIIIEMDINIPFSRGLGSSATAIVGGLFLAMSVIKYLYNIDIDENIILESACTIEGHPDNVSAAIKGGLIANVYSSTQKNYYAIPLTFRAPVSYLALIPNYQLDTQKAREVIPKTISMETATRQSSHLLAMASLFAKPEWTKMESNNLSTYLQDYFHQEQRLQLIPELLQIFYAIQKISGIGIYLSGSGSTLMIIIPHNQPNPTEQIHHILKKYEMEAVLLPMQFDHEGTKLSLTSP